MAKAKIEELKKVVLGETKKSGGGGGGGGGAIPPDVKI